MQKRNINKCQNIECNVSSGNKHHLLALPYQGEHGSHLVKYLKRTISKLLPEATQLEFGFTERKSSTHFQKRTKQYLNIIMMLFT